MKAAKTNSLVSVFVLFCCLCTSALFAQDYVRISDSILHLPVARSVKINLLKDKAKELFETDVNANIYYMEQALPLAEKEGKYGSIHFLYNNLGNSYLDKGDFSRALEFNLKCLKIAEKQRDTIDVINSWVNLGNTYTEQEENKIGKDCYLRAITLIKINNDEKLLADVYCNIALMFDYVKQKDSALFYMNGALEIYSKLKDIDGVALCSNNLGLVYMDNKNYSKSLYYLNQAKGIYVETKNDYSLFLTTNNIADLYLKTGEYQKSFNLYDSALLAFKDVGSQNLMIEVYRGLADASVKLGNFEVAHEYRKKYADLKDSVNSVENLSKFSDTKFKYEKEMSEKEIKLLKAENELKETRKRVYQILSFIALGFIVAVSFLFYNRYKIKQKSEQALRVKNTVIEEKNKSITDSINYAMRIQQAILPSQQEFEACFKEHLIFYKPKDIVSGDFYWLLPIIENGTRKVILATSDCTGHGVPGGFMSMLGSSLLTEIVNEKAITEPADVLDLLKIKIISSLKQKGTSGENQDGMDISLCKFDFQNHKLCYAAANNSIYHIRGGNIMELKPDKQPIGISLATNHQFSQHTIQLQANDCIYTITDGYADQFGGPKGKKYKYKQLENMLLSNAHLPMSEQREIIEQKFNEWKGTLEQVDDVLIIGVRV